jgi:hypothetical protein
VAPSRSSSTTDSMQGQINVVDSPTTRAGIGPARGRILPWRRAREDVALVGVLFPIPSTAMMVMNGCQPICT